MVPVLSQAPLVIIHRIIEPAEKKRRVPLDPQIFPVIDKVPGAQVHRILTEQGADLLGSLGVGYCPIQEAPGVFQLLLPLGLLCGKHLGKIRAIGGQRCLQQELPQVFHHPFDGVGGRCHLLHLSRILCVEFRDDAAGFFLAGLQLFPGGIIAVFV